jgi:hypothetical protein
MLMHTFANDNAYARGWIAWHFGLQGFFLAFEISWSSFKAKSIWDGVIEKIEFHLASWKIVYLSKGGRVYPYEEHTFQFAYIVFVPLLSPYECCKLLREASS